MRTYKFTFIFSTFLLLSVTKISFADTTFVNPSIYYTYGGYNNTDYSTAVSAFTTVGITKKNFLTVGYDNLKRTNINWDYTQQTYVAGLYSNYYPLIIKVDYLHLAGKFNYSADQSYNYSDNANLYSGEVNYFLSYNHSIGITGVYQKSTGHKTTKQYQASVRYDALVTPSLLLTIKPTYTDVGGTDSRQLFSTSFSLRYYMMQGVSLKGGGFFGNRAYYFDNDLLTYFNQDETQKIQGFIAADLSLAPGLTLLLSYQHTVFSEHTVYIDQTSSIEPSYSINYIAAGISYYFWL